MADGPNYNPGPREAWAETFRLVAGQSYTFTLSDSLCDGLVSNTSPGKSFHLL